MSNLPLRQLGSVGVITDASPYDLPPNAFSAANNVIFKEDRIQRAPVFKALFPPIRSLLTYTQAGTETYSASSPDVYISAQGSSSNASRFIGSYTDPVNGEIVFTADNDGTIRAYPQGVMAYQTPAVSVLLGTPTSGNTGSLSLDTISAPTTLPNNNTYKVAFPSTTTYTLAVNGGTPGTAQSFVDTNPITLTAGITVSFLGTPGVGDSFTFAPASGQVTNDNPWSHAQVSGVSILARKGMQPYARNLLHDTNYAYMGGDWVTGNSAWCVRNFMGFVVCLGMTENGKDYPTMVKWNNPAQYSTEPSGFQWDPANPSYVSGENVLGDLKNPIRDGLVLGNAFVIYSQNQQWLMEYTGDSQVFNFRRLPYEGGIVNTNCVVEVEGKHYVFGDNDIYVHDGFTKNSLASGRVRRRIFNTLDRSKQTSCFVLHDSVSKLIHFCYATLQDEATFSGTQFCNQSAIYNYAEDTWSFMDLPNIVGGVECNQSLLEDIFPDVQDSYELYNTTYTGFAGGGAPKIATMLAVYDQDYGLNNSYVYAIDLPTSGIVNLPAEPETLKTAYVERVGVSLQNTGTPLRSYKTVKCAVPLASFEDTTGNFTFAFGSSDIPEGTPNYRASVTYTPATDYKLDMMVSGRFLSYKVSTDSISNFQFSGMDLDIKSLSSR